MKNDIMFSNDAYFKALWFRIPLEIRQAINNAIEEGKFWVDIEKPTSSNDKIKLDRCVPILSDFGYLVKRTDNKSSFMTSYRISWESRSR